MSLVIVRHAESLWNVKDLFTGWLDIDLTEDGIKSAKELSILLKEENYNFDYIFTSDLIRTINTAEFICRDNLKEVIHSSCLRERDYGNLTGMNKKSAEELLGSELFFKIRRGFHDKPKNGESLSDVSIRVGNYFDNYIKHLLEEGNNVIIVAHGNSLRGLLVHLGIFDDNTIPNFELQSCVPILVDYNNKKIEYINKYYLEGLQILDSRGYPTIQVICKDKLTKKIMGKGSSPSGASCGSTEALELRDGDKNQYMGKSVFKAIDNLQLVNRFIPLNDNTVNNLKVIDNYLKKLDSSEFKSKLGGNTTTAISFCIADVASKLKNIEMYQYISQLYNDNKTSVYITPFVNIINGGKHSIKGDLKIQEFMIFPNEKYSIYKKIQIITEVYHSLKKILCEKYGEIAKSIGDEGGFCPPIDSPREAIDCIIEAIQSAGYVSETDVFLALDCAASEFYDKENKLYEIEKNLFINSDDLIDYYGKLIKDYPILKSIEDGFHEQDYDAWQKFTNLYGDQLMIVGDDLFTTNSRLIKYGLEHKLANSLLLKVNQIGTISEAIEGSKLFNSKNVIVSHRSGETNHAYIIDIAKGIGARFVKIGSPCRGERVEKFNRLLEIGNYNLFFQ